MATTINYELLSIKELNEFKTEINKVIKEKKAKMAKMSFQCIPLKNN